MPEETTIKLRIENVRPGVTKVFLNDIEIEPVTQLSMMLVPGEASSVYLELAAFTEDVELILKETKVRFGASIASPAMKKIGSKELINFITGIRRDISPGVPTLDVIQEKLEEEFLIFRRVKSV